MNQIKGYHTLEDRNNVDEIEANGPVKCTGKKAWVGHGYYFWEDDVVWAHKWGNQYNTYMIFEADITLSDKTFDLHSSDEDIAEFDEWVEMMIAKGEMRRNNVNISKVFEYIRRTTSFNSKYDTIRVSDMPEPRKMYTFVGGRLEKMYLGAYRIQVCLINKNSLVAGTFRVIYPSDYVN